MTGVRALLIVSIVAAAGVAIDAQSRTSDAVSAILRGDYEQAATILKPIVESRQQRDPTAAFFMATLYDNGRGVPADPLRACALYQQTFFDANPVYGASPASVYAPTAQLLQRRLWMAHGNEWLAECQLVANIGIDHRFEPKTFTLGAGHSVEWTLGTAAVTYENRTKPALWWAVGSPRGVIFLPIQYTALRTVASPAPLHFFSLFWWEPSAAQWTLRGRLFELYRDELVTVGSTDALTTVATADPPSLTPSDLETMMNVRLNADGAVEWTMAGARPATRPVATRAETVAAREKERARAEADARIDWNATLDVNRAPSMTYADAQGCGMFLLFAPSLDRGEVMTFRADAGSLDLTPQPRRFDLANDRRAFSLRIYVYERPVRADPCSDLRMPMPAEVAWQAVSGVVEVEVGIDPVARHRRRATVRILGAEFEGPAGKKIRLTRPILLSAIVGGVSG